MRERTRVLVIAIGLLTLFAVLIGKYYRLQIMEAPYWQQKAEQQHFFYVEEPFRRGAFFAKDRKLTFDLKQYHLNMDVKATRETHKSKIAAYLANYLGISQDIILGQMSGRSRNKRLINDLTPTQRKEIEAWWFPFAKSHRIARNALFFVPDWHRSYPFDSFLGQVLHTVQRYKDEATKRAFPTGGLEMALDPILNGHTGRRRLMRSPRHSFETGEIIQPPQHGSDIQLTIDPYIQAIVEEELAKGVEACKAKGGWAVMINPYNGHILAMGHYPFFAPEDYPNYFNSIFLIDHTRPKAISDAYEPGSVMKAITLSIALKANQELKKEGKPPLFNPTEKVDTSNSKFAGRSKPLKDTSFHHYLNMHMALQKSSNIYPARMIERILKAFGPNWYREQLVDIYGLGTKTGIELLGESSGVVPMPGRKYANGKLEWSSSTPFSLAMGHNIQATAVQLVRAYAVLANGGYLVKPTLIKGGEVKISRVLDAEIVDDIKKGLQYVTKPGGCGRRGDIYGYTEVAKSGTSMKIVGGKYSETAYVSSFMGFAPANQPEFVLLVSMDEPAYGYVPGRGLNHHGGSCSAPVFREIGRRTLAYLGTPQDDPAGFPKGDPRHNPDKAVWRYETSQLQEMYEKWNNVK